MVSLAQARLRRRRAGPHRACCVPSVLVPECGRVLRGVGGVTPLVETSAHNLHVGGIKQVGGQGGVSWLVGQVGVQMGAPEAAAQALRGGGEVVFEDILRAGRDVDGTPARIAHEWMTAQALTQVWGRHRVISNPCRKDCGAGSRATL